MTAATQQANVLAALADHLNANPDLPTVNIARDSSGYHCQISAFEHRGEPRDAAALVTWFDSLTDPVLTAHPWKRSKTHPRAARVDLTGKTANGTEIRVWELVQELGKILGFTKKDADPYAEVVFSVDILRDLAKAEAAQS